MWLRLGFLAQFSIISMILCGGDPGQGRRESNKYKSLTRDQHKLIHNSINTFLSILQYLANDFIVFILMQLSHCNSGKSTQFTLVHVVPNNYLTVKFLLMLVISR